LEKKVEKKNISGLIYKIFVSEIYHIHDVKVRLENPIKHAINRLNMDQLSSEYLI